MSRAYAVAGEIVCDVCDRGVGLKSAAFKHSGDLLAAGYAVACLALRYMTVLEELCVATALDKGIARGPKLRQLHVALADHLFGRGITVGG